MIKSLKKSNKRKRVKLGLQFVLKKKNGFLQWFTADAKLTQNSSDNSLSLTVLCSSEKFTKPIAHILVDISGKILAHNSCSSSVLELDELHLKKRGILNIFDVINTDCSLKDMAELSNSNIDIEDLNKKEVKELKGVSSPNNKHKQARKGRDRKSVLQYIKQRREEKTVDNRKRKSVRVKTITKTDQQTRRVSIMGIQELGVLSSNRGFPGSSHHNKGSEAHESLHFEISLLNKYNQKLFLINLWREDHGPEIGSLAQSRASGTRLTSHNPLKRSSPFFFKIDPLLRYKGSFDLKYAKKESNLKFDNKMEEKALEHTASKMIKLLSNSSMLIQKRKQVQIDYGAGIRTKRLWMGSVIDKYNDWDDEGSEDSYRFNGGHKVKEKAKHFEREAAKHKSMRFLKKKRKKNAEANLYQTSKYKKSTGSRHQSSNKDTPKSSMKTPKSGFMRQRQVDEDEEDTGSVDRRIKAVEAMRTKRQLSLALASRQIPKSLVLMIMMLILSLFAFTTFEIYSSVNTYVVTTDLVSFANLDFAIAFRSADIYNILSRVTDVCLANNGTDFEFNNAAEISENSLKAMSAQERDSYYKNFDFNINQEQMISENLASIKTSLDSLEDHNLVIQQRSESVSLSQNFSDYMNNKSIEMVKGGVTTPFSLNEAIRQIVSAVIAILDLPPKMIKFENPDVRFFIDNNRGKMVGKLIEFSRFANILKDNALKLQAAAERQKMIFMAVMLVTFSLVFYFGVYAYQTVKESLLDAFYGFESSMLEKQVKKLEKFSQILQLHQMGSSQNDASFDDGGLSDEEQEVLIEDDGGKGYGKLNFGFVKSRKKKGTIKQVFGAFRLLLLCPLLLACLWVYVSTMRQRTNIQENVEILTTVESISLSETLNYAALNHLESGIYDFSGALVRGQSIERVMNSYADRIITFTENSLEVSESFWDPFELLRHELGAWCLGPLFGLLLCLVFVLCWIFCRGDLSHFCGFC